MIIWSTIGKTMMSWGKSICLLIAILLEVNVTLEEFPQAECPRKKNIVEVILRIWTIFIDYWDT